MDEVTAGADLAEMGTANNLQIHNTTQASIGSVIFVLTAASKIDDIVDNIRKKALLAGKLNLPNLKNVSDVLTGLTASNKKNLLNLLKDADDHLLQQVNDALVKNPKLFDAGVPADLDGLKKLATGTEFVNASDVIDKIGKNPNLVDAWAILKKTEIDGLSSNVDNLESLNKALKQDGYDADYFEALLKSKDDPQRFINDYVSKVGDNGKFVDDVLETDYADYIKRKQKQGKPPRDRADWNEASDYMKYDSPTARGNNFNAKAKLEYDINELNLRLEDGSFVRIDSYVPAELSETGVGKIISRKATDLIDIKESTFRKHLQEMVDKYSPGTKIHSNVFDDIGETIEGKMYLELPQSNESFFDIERYKGIAKDYDIEIIFLME